MMNRLLGFLFFFSVTIFSHAQWVEVVNLRCEYRHDPVGVDEIKPKLSWELQSKQQNVLQTAYRILVSDDPLLLQTNTGNIWDSKKIVSGASVQVEYNGKTLQAAK